LIVNVQFAGLIVKLKQGTAATY